MERKKAYTAWAALFTATAVLGFIPNPQGLVKALMVLLCAVHFVPGFWLVFRGEERDRRMVRNLSAASLGLTLLVLILNFLTVRASAWVGNVMFGILTILSAPMVCGQYWVVSLFLWACLMITAWSRIRK